jgi:putative nucleotidyltransferase with HDIG domain
VGITRDITEFRRVHDELNKSVVRLQKSIEETIQAIAKLLEGKDPYTAGHQLRVAQLACAIAKEMQFSTEQIDGIRVAATVHDIGKIFVPSEILNKPGRLSENELNLIKEHPQNGYEVLKTIDFPWPVATIVLQHHRRIDGSGYPAGIPGIDILPESKVVMVADVVEAMTSHRPYRPALGIEIGLEEIIKNKGKYYDSYVVDACIKLFREKGFQFK